MAVLEHIAQTTPLLRSAINDLLVCRRVLTGAGSYTYFAPTVPVAIPDGYLTMDSLINMPGVPYGMGAALAMTSGYPEFLEPFHLR
nr:putative integron gene cassette protein [uncultured bacterium]